MTVIAGRRTSTMRGFARDAQAGAQRAIGDVGTNLRQHCVDVAEDVQQHERGWFHELVSPHAAIWAKGLLL